MMHGNPVGTIYANSDGEGFIVFTSEFAATQGTVYNSDVLRDVLAEVDEAYEESNELRTQEQQ